MDITPRTRAAEKSFASALASIVPVLQSLLTWLYLWLLSTARVAWRVWQNNLSTALGRILPYIVWTLCHRERLIGQCLIVAMLVSANPALATGPPERVFGDLERMVKSGGSFQFVIDPKNGNTAFTLGPHRGALVGAGERFSDFIRGVANPTPGGGYKVELWPATVDQRYGEWRGRARLERWLQELTADPKSRSWINAGTARDIEFVVNGGGVDPAVEARPRGQRGYRFQALDVVRDILFPGYRQPGGAGRPSDATTRDKPPETSKAGRPTEPTATTEPARPAGRPTEPTAATEPARPAAGREPAEPPAASRMGNAALAAALAGAAASYVACMALPDTTHDQCFELATSGKNLLQNAFWGAVAAYSPAGLALAATYGAVEGAASIGQYIHEYLALDPAGRQEQTSLEALQQQDVVSQHAVSENLRNCNFAQALWLARVLKQRPRPPAWVQTILPNLEGGAAAKGKVDSLLAQAAAVPDQTQKRQLLNQALASAGNTPCLIASVRQALNAIPAAEPPRTQPKPPEQPPPSAPPTSTETFKPHVLPPGRYLASFWTSLSGQLVEDFRKDAGKAPHPLPATLTIDANGNLSGTGRWELTPAETDRSTLKPNERLTNEVSFRLQGKIDWSGGAIVLRLTDGRKVHSHVEDGGESGLVITTEFDYDLSGWQVGHPALEKPYSDVIDLGKRSGFDPTFNPELYGYPNFGTAGDHRTYPDFGWAGIPEFDASGKWRTGQGGGASVTVKKDLWQYRHRFRGSNNDDQTASLKAAWEKNNPLSWYLKVLGPAPPEPVSDTPAAEKRGLVAFGLSPRNQIRVRSGQSFTLDAVGVYIDRPDELVNLNDIVSWEVGVGLTRLRTGELRALGPGRYKVTATLVRDGTSYSDTTEIIVEP